MKDAATEFWAGVRKTSTCWLWMCNPDKNGCGRFRLGTAGSKTVRAHRIAWELVHGPIPAGMHVVHTCDEPRCCNPEHLILKSLNKLTQEQVTEMRRRYAAGNTLQEELAKAYGVSRSTVSQIVRFKKYKNP